MKKILIIAMFFAVTTAKAQVLSATIQASGLTCSMCSNAINKSLRSLGFVEKVDANIKNSTFEISFKKEAVVDFDKIKAKVEDAGFFVANFSAILHFDNVAVENDSHIELNGKTLHFLNIKDQTINGDKTIKVLDKGFVTAKAYKQNGKYTLMQCYKTGVAGACCAKDGLKEGTRIYHVTMQ
jgi:copper chaperone CopZ